MRERCDSTGDGSILRIYGERGGEGGVAGSVHVSGCPRCRRQENGWRDLLAFYRESRRAGPALTEPPAALLAEIRPRPSKIRALATVAAIVLIFGFGAMEGTAARPVFAVTDRGLFWTLRSLHADADRIRNSDPRYEAEPFLDEIALKIREVDRLIDDARLRLEEW